MMNEKQTWIQRSGVFLLLILTPLLSLAIPFFISLPAEITPLLLVFVPALLALLFSALSGGRRAVAALLKKLVQGGIPFKWYAIALLMAFSVRFLISLLAFILGWIPAIQLNAWGPRDYLIIGVFSLVGAVMEELGWRGFALTQLLARRSAVASALIIGIPWGLVHIGLVLPGQMNAGTSWLATILFLIGLSVVLTWFFIRTGGSLIIPILYHAAQNFFVFLNGGIAISQSLWLLAIVTLALSLLVIVLAGPNMESRPEEKRPVILDGG